MKLFKTRKEVVRMRDDLRRLVSIEKEARNKMREQDHEAREKKFEIDCAEYKVQTAQSMIDEKIRHELERNKDLVTKWLPQIAAAFLTDWMNGDPKLLHTADRMEIAQESILMTEALVIEWRRHEAVMEDKHHALYNQEECDELGSA